MKVKNKTNDKVELSKEDVERLDKKWNEIKGELMEIEEKRIRKSFYNIVGYESLYLEHGDDFEDRCEKWRDNEEWDVPDKWWL